jgi:putative acetyltransferase
MPLSAESDMVIRLEEPSDAAQVREVNDTAFGTTTESRLVDALREAPGSISIVATVDSRVIGHILFTPVTIEPQTVVRVAGLGPISVRPEYQRARVGIRLVKAGLDECRRRGYKAAVVVGHPEYYPRFGFVPAHTKGLTCEFPVPPAVFMMLELEAGALRGVRGLVRYRPEFGAA